jgi:hypothetical protein
MLDQSSQLDPTSHDFHAERARWGLRARACQWESSYCACARRSRVTVGSLCYARIDSFEAVAVADPDLHSIGLTCSNVE